jgi:DNA-binding IscR family transcriptional regulator
VKGGYTFARRADEVTVLEVVELLDGPLGQDAVGVFLQAADAARAVLADWTIAAVADDEARVAGVAMYHI